MLPAEIDSINDRILDEWRRVDAELARLQAAVKDAPNEARRRARLAELRKAVKAETSGLREKTRAWVEGEFPGVYALGADVAAVRLGIRATFTQANAEAFNRIALDTHDDLLTATRFVERDAKRWIREEAATRTRLVIGAGDTARAGGRALAEALKPISAVRYANGSLHGIAEYSEMVVRTKTAVAYNYGSLDLYESAEVLYVEVIDGPGCHWYSHDDGAPANGLIVTASEARAHPIAHPNCRRSFSPRPDLTTPADAATAKPIPATNTPGRSAAPRSPEAAPSPGRSPRTPRTARAPRSPRGAAS